MPGAGARAMRTCPARLAMALSACHRCATGRRPRPPGQNGFVPMATTTHRTAHHLCPPLATGRRRAERPIGRSVRCRHHVLPAQRGRSAWVRTAVRRRFVFAFCAPPIGTLRTLSKGTYAPASGQRFGLALHITHVREVGGVQDQGGSVRWQRYNTRVLFVIVPPSSRRSAGSAPCRAHRCEGRHRCGSRPRTYARPSCV
jgi:hypothetical protein